MSSALSDCVSIFFHDYLYSFIVSKITNAMSLVDYPLFSWVVVIYSLHVSSFREAHHQEIIFPVQSASGIVYNLCCIPPVLLRVLLPESSKHVENK